MKRKEIYADLKFKKNFDLYGSCKIFQRFNG